MRRRRGIPAAALLAGAFFVAGCGNGADGIGEQPTGDETPPATTGEVTGGEDLPGDRVDLYPYEGAELGAMGVAADDVLQVREGPGAGFDSIAQLEPLATGITATGHNRQLEDGSFWSQITHDDSTGWASTAYLTHPGQVTDITAELEQLPAAPTMQEVGELVGQLRATEQPPSTVTVVAGPREGDLSEIVVDVVGVGDDALSGERLHVFALPEAEGYRARTVEATLLCARGVSDDGRCV